MFRICLISPGHLRSDPRLVKEADAIAAASHEVLVITGLSFPPYADEARTFSGRSWQVVARVPFGSLAPRVLRWKQRFRQRLALALCRLGLRPPSLVLRAWHPAAALAAQRHGAAYAFDAEDFHLGDWPEQPGFNLQRRLLRTIESR